MIEAPHALLGTDSYANPKLTATIHPTSHVTQNQHYNLANRTLVLNDAADQSTAIHQPSLSSLPLSIPPRRTARRHAKKLSQAVQTELPLVHSGSTVDNFAAVLKAIDLDMCEENGENAFYVCDMGEVYRQYLRWQSCLGGRVEPFFAVKCNPDPYVLHLFAKLGLGFDCASHAEIALVLGLGVSASNIIYANPCKAGSFVRHAHASGVQMMTFDNADELHKVAQHHPSAKMVLRILTDDRGSVCRFGEKFGAPAAEVPSLLETARSLGVDVIGVAFHVGSGCSNPALYKDALERAKWVFEIATQFGFNLELVDVGGGFGNDNFEILAEGLLAGLNEYFPIGCGVRVIAEPGRYFVTEAFELATNIIARRQLSVPKGLTDVSMPDAVESEDAPVTMYYINDGVYGAFNCIIFDHKVVHPKVLTLDGKFASEPVFSPRSDEAKLESFTPPLSLECSVASLDSLSSSTPEEKEHMSFASLELQPCKIFGPSCDSIDLVCPLAHLPTKALKVGDWLRWTDMGAYSVCAASQFNGFKISQVRYTIDAKGHPTLENELREILGRVY